MAEKDEDALLAFKAFESSGCISAHDLLPALAIANVPTDSKELEDALGFMKEPSLYDHIDFATFARIVRVLYMKHAGMNPFRIKDLFEALAEIDGRLEFGSRMPRNADDGALKELELELLKHDITFDVLESRGRLDYPSLEMALVETVKINKISHILQKNGILRAIATLLLPCLRNDNSVKPEDMSGEGLSDLIRQQADSLSNLLSISYKQHSRSPAVSDCAETLSERSAPKSFCTDDSFSRSTSNPRPTGRRLSFFQRMSSRKGSGDTSSNGERWWQRALVSPEGSMNETESVSFLQSACESSWAYGVGIWEASTWKNFLCFWFLWACSGVGAVMIVWSWTNQSEDEKEKEVERQASDISAFFSTELDRAVTPLYTLAVFVAKMSRLNQLAAVAMNFTLVPNSTSEFYDVKPWIPKSTTDEFNDISKEILQYAKSKSIRSLQLAPRGIVSLVHPLDGNDKALGLALLKDPKNAEDAYDSILNGNYSVTGPVNLVQDIYGIIVRLPIFVSKDTNGATPLTDFPGINPLISRNLSWWGFSTVIVDFTALGAESKIAEMAAANDLYFMITSTIAVQETEGLRYATRVIANNTDTIKDGVTVEISLPDDRWNLTVAPFSGFQPPWYSAGVAGSILGTFLLSLLSFLLLVEKRQRSMMLYRILPRHAVVQLRRRKQVVDVFDVASVFFSDLVGYTDLAGKTSPIEIVAMLNDLYTKFDRLVEKHQVCKVDTIGDAYMVIAGAGVHSTCDGPEAASRVAKFALDALDLVARSDYGIRMRAGIASGPVVAAVLGSAVPKYSFFGDTVNTASRMESTGEAGKLQVTEETRNLLEQSKSKFTIIERMHANGQAGVLVKGKGLMQTYWIRNLIREEV